MLLLRHRDADAGEPGERHHARPLPQLARRVSQGPAQPAGRTYRSHGARGDEGHARRRGIAGARWDRPSVFVVCRALLRYCGTVSLILRNAISWPSASSPTWPLRKEMPAISLTAAPFTESVILSPFTRIS